MIIQGITSHDVVLRNMRVIEQHETKLPSGTSVSLRRGCGGDLPQRNYRVTLGIENPPFELVTNHDDGSVEIAKKPFGYKVSATDPEIFAIAAHTPYGESSECSCLITWKLALDWTYKGKQGTLIIDDQGGPFRTGVSDRSDQYPHLIKGDGVWK